MKKSDKNDKKKLKTAIVLYVIVAIFIIYGIAEIIYSVTHNGFGGVYDIIFTIVIGGIFSFIFLASARGAWGKFLRSKGFVKEAEEYEAAVEELQTDNNTKPKFSKKGLAIGLCIFIICGAVGSFAIWFGNTQLKKITGDEYIKTTATIANIEADLDDDGDTTYSLCYEFTDENGIVHYATDNSSWGQINFTVGNEVTIYYSRTNPDSITTLATPVLLFCVGSFFIVVSFLILLVQLGVGRTKKTNSITSLIVGLVFSGFGIAMYLSMYFAGGGSFISILLNGAVTYALGCFIIVGLLFIVYSVYSIIRNAFFPEKDEPGQSEEMSEEDLLNNF